MTSSLTTVAGDRIIDPMLALAGCSKQHRIVVAGSKGVELMLELQRRGYVRHGGHGQLRPSGRPIRRGAGRLAAPHVQDPRGRAGLVGGFPRPTGVLVVWVDPQKEVANEALRASLERRGFVIEAGAVHDCGCAVSARRREANALRKAA